MTRLVFRSQDEDEGSVQIQTSCIVAQPHPRPSSLRPDGEQGAGQAPPGGVLDLPRDSPAHTEHQRYQPLQVQAAGS